jgi:hypothetical protein
MPLGSIEKLGVIENGRDVSALTYADDVNVLGEKPKNWEAKLSFF